MSALPLDALVVLTDALAAAATPGPWAVEVLPDDGAHTEDLMVVTGTDAPSVASICRVSVDPDDDPTDVLADAAFIAMVRAAWPALSADWKRLKDQGAAR